MTIVTIATVTITTVYTLYWYNCPSGDGDTVYKEYIGTPQLLFFVQTSSNIYSNYKGVWLIERKYINTCKGDLIGFKFIVVGGVCRVGGACPADCIGETSALVWSKYAS